MFIDPTEDELRDFEPQALVLHAPALEAEPEVDGTRTGTFVVLHPSRREILIGGTFYAGEIKKWIFTLMNDRLPLEGVFPMHCSANVGDDGDVAVFFGLSGTGKTTLSADPERHLIGDDEHGWGDDGVFNFEGGCYAKVIRLSAGGRAGDLQDDALVRDDPRERRPRRERERRPRRRLEDREHARRRTSSSRSRTRLPTKRAGHPQSVRLPDRRRVRDPAADRASHARPGDVLVPLRLHREARRHRDRRQGAPADLLRLLRRALPAAAARRSTPGCSRRSSTSTAPAVWLVNTGWTGGMYGEGERMPIDGDARASCAPRSPASSTASSTGPTSCSASRCRSRCRASTRSCSIPAPPGATPTPTTRRRASSRRCSATTSRSSTPTTTSSPAGRALERRIVSRPFG